MKKYFVLFALAVLVILAGLTLRRAMTATSASAAQSTTLVAIGVSPVPVPPLRQPAPRAR